MFKHVAPDRPLMPRDAMPFHQVGEHISDLVERRVHVTGQEGLTGGGTHPVAARREGRRKGARSPGHPLGMGSRGMRPGDYKSPGRLIIGELER